MNSLRDSILLSLFLNFIPGIPIYLLFTTPWFFSIISLLLPNYQQIFPYMKVAILILYGLGWVPLPAIDIYRIKRIPRPLRIVYIKPWGTTILLILSGIFTIWGVIGSIVLFYAAFKAWSLPSES